ncbi:hypothetical protein H4R33_003526 [Dimargaris cristalligena]|nr:hypothetical protein H4R33_003526 [Dimargaris cristalligena]
MKTFDKSGMDPYNSTHLYHKHEASPFQPTGLVRKLERSFADSLWTQETNMQLHCYQRHFFNKHEVSSGFLEFMWFLGDIVELSGWSRYRAGLDAEKGTTGHYSLYTNHSDYEIMFHVAPLLPFNPIDFQRIERKRHIGNDILVIVYHDSELPYDISTITSKQNHIICIVKPEQNQYRVEFLARESVPSFGPLWSAPFHLSQNNQSRELFLEKSLAIE